MPETGRASTFATHQWLVVSSLFFSLLAGPPPPKIVKRCTSEFFRLTTHYHNIVIVFIPRVPPPLPVRFNLSSITTTPSLCHHNALSELFTLLSLTMQLDLQIQAPIISSSSSEKFGTMILGEEAHLTSSISPPPTPAIAVTTTAVASYPPAGWGGACRSILGGGAGEILACLR